ncbi:MAG: hypothetical protein LUD03_06545 [Firmicutes bacterium]|nr:hypothetical protein [Bacillota bacterium]
MAASILKKAFLTAASVLIAFSVSVSAYAEPEGEADMTADAAADTYVESDYAAADGGTEAVSAETQNNSENERGGVMSVGGVILVAVLVVIINTVISFVVANRFYKLTKKDSHIQSEIRALRRDIDDKFSGNIKQIKEKEIRVKNSNPDYSGGDKIKVPKASQKQTDDKEIAEFAKRWNIEIESDEEPELKGKSPNASRASYSPERKKRPEKKADAEQKPKQKSRAKEFMGEIFPFDEED